MLAGVSREGESWGSPRRSRLGRSARRCSSSGRSAAAGAGPWKYSKYTLLTGYTVVNLLKQSINQNIYYLETKTN